MKPCRLLLSLLLLAGAVGAEAAAPELPGDSLYQLDLPMVDQNGSQFAFSALRGRPRVVAMFYTSCRYVCPLIIDTAMAIDHAMPAADRERYGVLLVSFDPVRDDVAALASVAAKRHLDPTRWQLVRTDAAHVRELAAALNIQYRELVGGEFNHASLVSVLDAEGRLVKQSDKLGTADADLVAALRATLGEH